METHHKIVLRDDAHVLQLSDAITQTFVGHTLINDPHPKTQETQEIQQPMKS